MILALVSRHRIALAIGLVAIASCSSGGGSGSSPASCAGIRGVPGTPALGLERVTSGIEHPVDLQPVPGRGDAWVVAEQGGVLRLWESGALREAPFLDIRDAITTNPESGLLAFAFHPDFPRDPRVFVRYSIDEPLQTVLDEFTLAHVPELALEPASARRLMAVGRDELGHDGGSLAFGPDGLLYVTVGDGGPLRDPKRKAQDLSKLSGKLLRIDVDRGETLEIPPSNPFVGREGARGEIFAFGLRNPWRASFDRATGDLWIADVGEDEREEIDLIGTGSPGGQNFGWNRYEGTLCVDADGACDTTGLTPPLHEYPHVEPGGAPPGGPCSITGGFVYQGCAMPGWRGTYFYGDLCAGFVRSFRASGGAVTDEQDWSDAFRPAGLDSVVAFGQDSQGELYVLDYVDGDVFKIVPVPDS